MWIAVKNRLINLDNVISIRFANAQPGGYAAELHTLNGTLRLEGVDAELFQAEVTRLRDQGLLPR